MTLTNEEKVEFVDFCIRTGFMIEPVELWKKSKITKKVQQYKKKGYRIVIYDKYDEFKIINIFDDYNEKIIENLERLYLDAMS